MYQLTVRNKVITYPTISFDLRSEFGASSYIKLGGFDIFAFENQKQDDMKLFKTNNKEFWHLPFDKVTNNKDEEINMDTITNVELDIAVRYIYVAARQLNYDSKIKPIVDGMTLP